MSRFCEEFHCLPSAAVREWDRAPVGLLEGLLELRAYAGAYQVYTTAQKKSDLPRSPLIDLVREIEFALMRAQLEE